jgi:hypothetical protein
MDYGMYFRSVNHVGIDVLLLFCFKGLIGGHS